MTREPDERNDIGTAATGSDAGSPVPGGEPRRAVAAPVGAIGGAAAGAAAGTVTLGPIGTIVGAIVGAVGGAWTGLAAAAPRHYGEEHDREYRTHYESDPNRVADRSFDTARPAYQLGHLAARNPDYAHRDFDTIESDLRHGWSDDIRARHGDWDVARRYAREAFLRERARQHGRTPVELNMGGTDSHQRPSFSDPLPAGDPDLVAGERGVPGHGGASAS
jgi:hypothetical protein